MRHCIALFLLAAASAASARPLDDWTIATLDEGCTNAGGDWLPRDCFPPGYR